MDNKCRCLQCLRVRITAGTTKQHKKGTVLYLWNSEKLLNLVHALIKLLRAKGQRFSTCNIISSFVC